MPMRGSDAPKGEEGVSGERIIPISIYVLFPVQRHRPVPQEREDHIVHSGGNGRSPGNSGIR